MVNELPHRRTVGYQMSCRSRIKSGMTDKPAPAISKPGASRLDFWIPAIRRAARLEPFDKLMALSETEGLADTSHDPEWPVVKISPYNRPLRTVSSPNGRNPEI